MTVKQATYPTVEFLIGKFADWLKHRRELNEIRQLNRNEFDLIANDLRISAARSRRIWSSAVRIAPTNFRRC